MKKKIRIQNLFLAGFLLLVIGCAVVITLVAEKMEERLHLRWDLTNNQVYSIGDTTKKVLDNLDKDITIYTIYNTGEEDRTISELLRRYKQENTHIEVINIDPIEQPNFTKQFIENEEETIEVSSLIISEKEKDNYRIIKAQDLYEWQLEEEQLYATGMVAEQRITAAISSIQGGMQHTAYFVTGHGEMDISDIYYLSETLKSDGYHVESYDLIYNDKALKSEDCLLFLAPSRDLTDEETQIVSDFISDGGRLIFFANPLAGEIPNFNHIFSTYGMQIEDSLIVEGDTEFYLNSPVMIRPQMNEESPILQSVIASDTGIVLPRSRGISLKKKEEVKADPIVSSSSKSYGKTNPYTETLEKEPEDVDGPFSLGIAAQNTKNNSRVVLFGSSDFVSTLDNAKFEGNIALFMDSVAWSSEKENSIIIEPKSLVSAPLRIKNTATASRLMILVIIVYPLLILSFGAWVWRRRLSK